MMRCMNSPASVVIMLNSARERKPGRTTVFEYGPAARCGSECGRARGPKKANEVER